MRTAFVAAISVVGWLLVVAYVAAIIATVALVVLLWRRHQHAWACGVGGATIALVVAIAQVPWNGVFGQSWYAAHRAKFQALAEAARQGELRPEPGGWVQGRNSSVPNFGHGLQDEPIPDALASARSHAPQPRQGTSPPHPQAGAPPTPPWGFAPCPRAGWGWSVWIG